MAKNPNFQSKRPARPMPNRPVPKAAPQPKRKTKEAAAEEATTGNILWRLALIFCTALVVISLVVASVNGGSQLIGGPENNPNTTPTPPAATPNINQSVSGSDATPIPPSPTPAANS